MVGSGFIANNPLRTNYPKNILVDPPVAKPVRAVVESRAAFADPGGEIGGLI